MISHIQNKESNKHCSKIFLWPFTEIIAAIIETFCGVYSNRKSVALYFNQQLSSFY